jgi:hypothetical protein
LQPERGGTANLNRRVEAGPGQNGRASDACEKEFCDEPQVLGAALRESEVTAALRKNFELRPTWINDWKRQLLDREANECGHDSAPESVDLMPLHAKMPRGPPVEQGVWRVDTCQKIDRYPDSAYANVQGV